MKNILSIIFCFVILFAKAQAPEEVKPEEVVPEEKPVEQPVKENVQQINNKKKDVDLIFKDENNKVIYYREMKGNIELDTEKLPATISKCKEIEYSFTFNTCSIIVSIRKSLSSISS